MPDEDRQTFPGLYVGTVEEVNELGLGRIRVSFPSIPDLEAWARPCFPYGHFFVPQPQDKVWIAFEGGDPNYPVWLGIWYPEGTVPPPADETHDSEPVQRLIRSASGHLLLFDDTKDATKIAVNSAGGHSLVFDDTRDKEGIVLTVGSNTITLDNEKIELKVGGSTITLKNEKIELKVDGSTITLKADDGINDDGIKLKGRFIDLN
jgi:uncharacterized protein involved in type VI secretion and phage assembly